MVTLAVIGLAIVGFALLWAANLLHGRKLLGEFRVAPRLLTRLATAFLCIGGLGLLLGVGGWLGIGVWIVAIAVWFLALREQWVSRLQWLFLCLAYAARDGIPLGTAARAFSLESQGEMAARTRRLADLLDAGVPFVDAAHGAHVRLPLEVELAWHCKDNIAANADDVLRRFTLGAPLWALLQPLSLRLAYLIQVMLVVPVVGSFVMFQIDPALAQIGAVLDPEGMLSGPTPIVGGVSPPIGTTSVQLIGILCLVVNSLSVASLFTIIIAGILAWEPPVVRRAWHRYHGAMVLTALAPAVAENRPLVASLAAPARRYPRAHIRDLLVSVRGTMEGGIDWTDALRRHGLIECADAALLCAAQRVGNLAWGMQETAASMVRRLVERFRMLMNVLFVTIILLAAVPVFALTISVMTPLAQFIWRSVP